MAIVVDKLSQAIMDSLDDYSAEVNTGVDKLAKKVATVGKDELYQTSPKKTGDYRLGWAVKKNGRNYVIYNKTNYQLTHLLEKGHLKRDGRKTPAIPHIAPVEKKAIEDFEMGLEVLLQNG